VGHRVFVNPGIDLVRRDTRGYQVIKLVEDFLCQLTATADSSYLLFRLDDDPGVAWRRLARRTTPRKVLFEVAILVLLATSAPAWVVA